MIFVDFNQFRGGGGDVGENTLYAYRISPYTASTNSVHKAISTFHNTEYHSDTLYIAILKSDIS